MRKILIVGLVLLIGMIPMLSCDGGGGSSNTNCGDCKKEPCECENMIALEYQGLFFGGASPSDDYYIEFSKNKYKDYSIRKVSGNVSVYYHWDAWTVGADLYVNDPDNPERLIGRFENSNTFIRKLVALEATYIRVE